MGRLAKLGFHSKRQVGAFLTVVFSGQVVYASFESLKIPFYEPYRQLLGLSNEQFGTIFTMLGVALLFYIPGGWVNTRVNVKHILFWGLAWRVATGLIVVTFLPPYRVLLLIALSWGILDGVFWPAVIKGVALLAGSGNKSIGFGVLNGFRAGGEAILSGILIAVMSFFHGSVLIFRTGIGIYACLGLLVMVFIWLYVPADEKAPVLAQDEFSAEGNRQLDSRESLAALWLILKRVDMWVAGLMGMCVYWVYTVFIYSTPFLMGVYGASQSFASTVAVATGVIVGVLSGLLGGVIADKVFHSATRMLVIVMALDGLILLGMRALPTGPQHLWLAVVAMSTMGFFTFMGKTIQQAPVTELNVAPNLMGSAVSVNSFFGFACILWALKLNGHILDTHANNPEAAFDKIFFILAMVAFAAAILATVLEFLKSRGGNLTEGETEARLHAQAS